MKNRLINILREKNMKQSDLCRKAKVSASQVCKFISNSDARLAAHKIVKIADALNVSLDYLLCRDEYVADKPEVKGIKWN